MEITYSFVFGLPSDNLVQYDSDLQVLKTQYADEERIEGKTCVLYSPSNELKLRVMADSGEIIGLEINVGTITSMPKAGFACLDCTDGCVKVSSDCGKLISDCNYLINFNRSPSYDCDKRLIVFGDFTNDGIAVRICKNLFLSLDSEEKLCGIAVKI